jgi:carbon storage regulator CsrA
MLVLTRKKHESISIYDENEQLLAKILVVRTSLGSVRLGIETDPNHKILRDELERKALKADV